MRLLKLQLKTRLHGLRKAEHSVLTAVTADVTPGTPARQYIWAYSFGARYVLTCTIQAREHRWTEVNQYRKSRGQLFSLYGDVKLTARPHCLCSLIR